MSLRHSRGSAAGNIITLLLLLGIIGLGAWLWLGKKEESKPASDSAEHQRAGESRQRRCQTRRRCARSHRARDRHADARSREHLRAEGQRAAHRHQRVRGIRRPHRRERRPRAERGFILREGIRLQGRDLDERERDLGSAQQRQARRHGHHGRRAGGARPAVRRDRADPARLLARR